MHVLDFAGGHRNCTKIRQEIPSLLDRTSQMTWQHFQSLERKCRAVNVLYKEASSPKKVE